MRSFRFLAHFAVTLSTAGLVAAGCSSGKSDTGGDSGGSGTSGSTSHGGSSSGAKGGASAAGGSSNAASSGGSSNGAGASGGSGGSGNGSSSGGSGNVSASGGSGAYPTDACDGVPFGEAGAGTDGCTGVSSEAEPVALDLFIMMDRSISMNNPVDGTDMTRWEALQAAVEAFTQSSASNDIRVGIGFFGITGGNDDELDCNASNYATPTVPIGALADVGPDLVAAMAKVHPGGLTPAAPALAGAYEYAASVAGGDTGRATAVLLVTDGYPTQCQPTSVAEIAAMAKEAHLNAPYLRTYVIGLSGDVNLDAIAVAGGTHAAFKVDEGDVTSSFEDALGNVTNTKIACEYALPPPPDGTQKLDLTRVQVTYTTASDDATEEIPAIGGIESCTRASNGGWYYDNPDDPTSILVCPCTCTRFEAGRVDVSVGCRPAVGPR